MPRPRFTRSVRELSLNQHTELVIGIGVPTYIDTGESKWTDEADVKRYYESRGRRSYQTLEDLKTAWFEHREVLLAQSPRRPWAARFDPMNGHRKYG